MRQVISIKIEADVEDGFAIHPSVGDDMWSVTHVKSGMGCSVSKETEWEAEKYREELRKIQVDGMRLADMDAKQAIETFPLIYDQLQELRGNPIDLEHRARAIKKLERHVALMEESHVHQD